MRNEQYFLKNAINPLVRADLPQDEIAAIDSYLYRVFLGPGDGEVDIEWQEDGIGYYMHKHAIDELEDHSNRLTHPDFKSQLKVSDGPSYANFGCNVVGEPTLEFFPSKNGNAYSNHEDSNQLEHEIQELSNSLGIAGKISLKEKLTFDVVWQRKLPEMFYPLRFHTKKIRIFD